MKKIYKLLYFYTLAISTLGILIFYKLIIDKAHFGKNEIAFRPIANYEKFYAPNYSVLNHVFQVSQQQTIKLPKNVSECELNKVKSDLTRIRINGSIYPKLIALHENNSINFNCLNEKIKEKKRILLWNNIVRLKDSYGNKKTKFKCPITDCVISGEENDLNKSNLVIFNLNDPYVNLPRYRPSSNQLWANFMYKPIGNGEKYDFNQFNFSITYRSSSNLVSYYYRDAYIKWHQISTNYSFILNNKTHMVACIINDDCLSSSMVFLKFLNNQVQVDIYGKCGISCNGSYDECLKFISTRYKYFVVMESQMCTNYVSEKFFKILKHDILPIVFKYFNHDLYVPKSAFIDASQYDSVNHLGEYIQYLETNLTNYQAYFEWKKYVTFRSHSIEINPLHSIICDACIKLHLNDVENKAKSINENEYDSNENCFLLKISDVNYFNYSEPYSEENDPDYDSIFKTLRNNIISILSYLFYFFGR